MRCLMFGAGSDTFATGWAKAALNVSEVVGVHSSRSAPPSTQTPHGVARRDEDGIIVVGVDLGSKLRPKRIAWRLNDRTAAHRIARALDQAGESGGLDLVHSHFYAGAGLAARVAERLELPLIHTEHSSTLLPSNRYKKASAAGISQARYLYERAARVLFVSPHLLEAALNLGLRGNFEVVPNPVEDDVFRAVPRNATSTTQFVTVGSLIPSKRHDLLLTAFATARVTDSRLRLRFVGTGPLRSDLESLASRLGLDESVKFHGSLSKTGVAKIVSHSDIYVHSSAAETFGLALVEALACGLPLVTTDCGGVLPVLSDYPVRVVKSAQPEDLARAMVSAAENFDDHDRGETARKTSDQFGLRAVGARIGDVYAQVTRAD